MADSKAKTPIIQITSEKTDLRKKEPPLVDLKVTNPVTYFKSWWKKILGNEGIDFRFKVKPLTAIAISIIVVTVSMGFGRFVLPFDLPFFEFTTPPTGETPLTGGPPPTTEPVWRDTAFSGELRYSTGSQRYYLFTASSEAIVLAVPDSIDLKKLVGKRIFATGSFNDQNRVLQVSEAADMELLPAKIVPIPTVKPLPTPPPTDEPPPTGIPSPPPTGGSLDLE